MRKILLSIFLVLVSCSLAFGGTIAIGKKKATGLTPAYENTGGTGDRTSIITITFFNIAYWHDTLSSLVDGTNDSGAGYWEGMTYGSVYPWIKFDFGSGHTVLITEAKFYQSTTGAQGTWKWQGSNNDSDWTDIGSAFSLGGTTVQTQTELSGNTVEYRYYMLIMTNGVTSNGPYHREWEFKIDGY